MAEGGPITRIPRSGSDELLEMLREEFPGYHPVLAMVRMAHEDEVKDELRFAAHKEAAQYVLPKLRQIEHRMGDEEDNHLHVVLEGHAEELDAPPPLTPEELEAADNRSSVPELVERVHALEEEPAMFEEVTPANFRHRRALTGTSSGRLE